MIGKNRARNLVRAVMRKAEADQTEILIYNFDQELTRFANNHIHQNVQESNTVVSVRSIFGKKIGSAATNSLDMKKLDDARRHSETIARCQRENPDFKSLPGVNPRHYHALDDFGRRTAKFDEVRRAAATRIIIDVARTKKLNAFGSVSMGNCELVVANSLGVMAYSRSNDAFCNIVMAAEDSSGYAQAGDRDVGRLDFKALATTAAQKALLSRKPVVCPPGRYTAVLEPLAVSDLLSYMAYYAFNGLLYEEGRSYLTGKIGTRVVDDRISIVDDPYNRRGFRVAFDFEGVPKKRTVLIERGVARNVVYDSLTATRAKKKSTGHALGAPNPTGPVPTNLVMGGGDATVDDLVKTTKKGILVTRLHYSNVIDPLNLTVTGMTRDGTFLIENGAITAGVKNMRFTEALFKAFNNVGGIARSTRLVAEEPGYRGRFGRGAIVPWLKINDFTFTSATEF